MTENERIKELRQALKLKQEEFGNRIGLTKSSISNIENGTRSVTEKHIMMLEKVFNVNENWLRTGYGEMFIENDSTIITELASEYRLDDFDKMIIEHYVKLNSDDRKIIKNYILSLAAKMNENEIAASVVEDKIEAEVEKDLDILRQELRDEKKAQMLSASHAKDIG